MRQGLLSFKAIAEIKQMKLAKIILVSGLTLLGGCSVFGNDETPDVTGESAADVNWTFADATAMEAKVASLQSDNARLSRKVMELERELEQAENRTANAIAEADVAPSLKEPPTLEPQAPSSLASAATTKPEKPVIDANVQDAELDAAPVPVEEAPRLVQPTFASANTDTVFENEMPVKDAGRKFKSALWGVHLASYRAEREAREGWIKLQKQNPDELGLLEPRIENVEIEGRGKFLRLIGGGFTSSEKAQDLCSTLASKGLFCKVSSFDGDRLSFAENTKG
ncbi:MAG: SPOR domain-containing protein [Pseudomonadota bacterium]